MDRIKCNMMLKRFTILFLTLCGLSYALPLNAQGKISKELAISGFLGGSYLPGDANHLSGPYYEDLRLGINFGGQAILFFGTIGVGFNYSQSNFSASGEEINVYDVDEDYSFKFYGPVLASRIEVNSSNQIVFAFAFGKSISQNDATIDGETFRFENDDFVPRIAITYHYKFSDFAFNAGLQFINEKAPLPQAISRSIGVRQSIFQYESGTNFDRLSLSLGVTYYVSNLF